MSLDLSNNPRQAHSCSS